MSTTSRERATLRDLAKRYRELCDSERNQRKIALWRATNSGRQARPVVWCNLGLLGGDIENALPDRTIGDTALADVERWFQKMLWTASIGDDRVFDPWFTVRAEMFTQPEGPWGVLRNTVRDPASRGWRNMPVLREIDDLDRLKATPHMVIDQDPPTARLLDEIFGDIVGVHVNKSTAYPKWGGTDLSEAAACLMGLEELLYALYEKPEMIHRFMAFMRDSVLDNIKAGENAGDFSTAETQNYMVPAFCDDLPDPAAHTHGARLKELCFFTHSQEFEAVSPAQHEEFLLVYQIPITELFGKVNYGCCETLDTKLDILKKIPNLNKICVGPLADISVYPDKIDENCIISWRPNAAPMVCRGFDPDNVRMRLRDGFEKARGRSMEVHLHEPMTVEGDLSRISRWAEIAIDEAQRIA